MHTSRLLAILIALASLGLAASAQDEADASFKNTLAAGLTLTDGNSETLQANASLLSVGEKEGLGTIRAGIEANYGESQVADTKETTVDNAKAYFNAKKTLSRVTFSYVDLSVMYDDIAKVDYRTTFGPGLGLYVLKSDARSLLVEAGPAYIWEKVDGVSSDYLAIRVAERFELQLSETANLWQSAEYLPEAEDFENYLLNAEVGIEAAVNSRVSLRLVYQYKYDNQPGEDLEKGDRTLIAGVSVSL